MQAWTDYPIIEFGDMPGKPALMRKCEAVSWDGNKYAQIIIGGIKKSIKAGYLYTEPTSKSKPININLLPET